MVIVVVPSIPSSDSRPAPEKVDATQIYETASKRYVPRCLEKCTA